MLNWSSCAVAVQYEKIVDMNDVTTLAEEVFTSAEVKHAAMVYFGGDELAATTWMNKYAVKTEQTRFIEKTPVDMHQRMAVDFARMEQKFNARAEGRHKTGIAPYGTRQNT